MLRDFVDGRMPIYDVDPTIRKATIRRLEASTYWGRPRKSGGEIRVNRFRNRRVNGEAAAQVRVFSRATSPGLA